MLNSNHSKKISKYQLTLVDHTTLSRQIAPVSDPFEFCRDFWHQKTKSPWTVIVLFG